MLVRIRLEKSLSYFLPKTIIADFPNKLLDAVQRLRPQMEALPETSDADETANPWNVRETLLNTGRSSALGLEQWETALELNAAIVKYKSARGADEVELARTRFNDYGPLLRLRRLPQARALLEYCRAVQEQAHVIVELGKILSALASLEDKEGNRAAAESYEKLALRYSYQAAQPEDIAISHNNLANYLQRAGAPQDEWLAHRLAAAIIFLQSSSGNLVTVINSLANSDLSAAPPSFDSVVATVERLEGVRFREMFDKLDKRAASGDEAVAVVWQMARERKTGRQVEREQEIARVLASLPDAVRAAFELDGDEFSAALKSALSKLPEDEAAQVLQELRDADLIGGGESAEEKLKRVLREFDPLLRAVAAVANGDEKEKQEIEAALANLKENGWHLVTPVQRIWNGERDAASLTQELDEQDSALVKRILEYVDAMRRGKALAQTDATPDANANANALPLPAAVVAALQAQDVEALRAALAELPEAEALAIVKRLKDAGIIE